jgi:hypothetical protein
MLKNYMSDVKTGEEGVTGDRSVEGVEKELAHIPTSTRCAFVPFDVVARRVSEGTRRPTIDGDRFGLI